MNNTVPLYRLDVDIDNDNLRIGLEVEIMRTIASKWNFKPIFMSFSLLLLIDEEIINKMIFFNYIVG